jgi:putative transposase
MVPSMPREARLDAPGLAHHVIARGLNRQKIFLNTGDYADFLERIPRALDRSPNEILAWALMPNHIHVFIRSGPQGIAPFFRRLFTGYAGSFNRRHKRVGYLFQGRYKSIVCDHDEYFLALVRYIHLNPLVGGLVRSLEDLGSYPSSGHSALLGRHDRAWQAKDEVLGRFGKEAGVARRGYMSFLRDGLPEVAALPTDLLGGGLIERLQEAVQDTRREADRPLHDPRVLGESDFVQRVWNQVREQEHKTRALKRKGIDVRRMAKRIAQACGVAERDLFMRGRQAAVSAAKAALIFAGIEYLGKTTSEMARLTQMTTAAACKARLRGQALQKKLGIRKLIS